MGQQQLQLLRTTLKGWELGVQRLLPPRGRPGSGVVRLQGDLRGSPALSQHPRLLAQRLRLGGGPWAPAPYSTSTACSREPQPPPLPGARPGPTEALTVGRGRWQLPPTVQTPHPRAYPPFGRARRAITFDSAPGVTQTSDARARKLPHCPRPAPLPAPPRTTAVPARPAPPAPAGFEPAPRLPDAGARDPGQFAWKPEHGEKV